MVRIKLKALHMEGKLSTNELFPSPVSCHLKLWNVGYNDKQQGVSGRK